MAHTWQDREAPTCLNTIVVNPERESWEGGGGSIMTQQVPHRCQFNSKATQLLIQLY